LNSHILIGDDFEKIKEELKEEFAPENLVLIERDELKIEDAKEIVKEAYIASKEERLIAVFALRYNIYAQNALLKLLEEPPKRCAFILVAKSKFIFLPTILSRLPVKKLPKSAEDLVEFESFTLEELYNLAQKSKEFSKAKAKGVLKGMLHYALKKDFPLTERELDYFKKGMHLLELSTTPANVFITAGLILLTHQKRKYAR